MNIPLREHILHQTGCASFCRERTRRRCCSAAASPAQWAEECSHRKQAAEIYMRLYHVAATSERVQVERVRELICVDEVSVWVLPLSDCWWRRSQRSILSASTSHGTGYLGHLFNFRHVRRNDFSLQAKLCWLLWSSVQKITLLSQFCD